MSITDCDSSKIKAGLIRKRKKNNSYFFPIIFETVNDEEKQSKLYSR